MNAMSGINSASGNQYDSAKGAVPESKPTPMTRDLNVLGESIARLEANLDILHKQLDPVIRPMPPEGTTDGAEAPQLVKTARSDNGNTLERFAASVESLISHVQFLQRAVEV